METLTPLNQELNTGPVSITYNTTFGPIRTEKFELLVVACDPRNLTDTCNYSDQELELFARLKHFQFHTSLLKVTGTSDQIHTVIFSPKLLQNMQGEVYAFRNETAKQFGMDAARGMNENLVTVYQLADPGKELWPAKKFEDQLKHDLPLMKSAGWWPYDLGTHEPITTVTTPYFNHFDTTGIQAGLPWQFLDLQGSNNTIYVHGSTCFESIYDCWAYANLLMQQSQVQKALPKAYDAPIAVLGAGASGLLFALRLKKLGYTNIAILESTDRYGCKTHSIRQDGPYPPGVTDPTICELGACYLSPSYDPMVTDLAEYLVDNERVDFTLGNARFRGVVTDGEFLSGTEGLPAVMDYGTYVLKKAEMVTKYGDVPTKFILAWDLAKYSHIYYTIMGSTPPMPATPPQQFLKDHGGETFLKFLKANKLEALTGILQYGYQVQGYGSIDQISAFYGLVWITPQIMLSILYDSLVGLVDDLPLPIEIPQIPLLTSFSKGWGNLWEQIVLKEQFEPILNVEITSIVRGGS